MLCEECEQEYKPTPERYENGLFGLCPSCGKKLKYQGVVTGFNYGVATGVLGLPFIIVFILEWKILVAYVVGLLIVPAMVWFFARKQGGYMVYHSVKEYREYNLGFTLLFGFLGCVFSFIWAFLWLGYYLK